MSSTTPAFQEGLRERHVPKDEEKSNSSSALDTPESEQDGEKEKKTFGRTPDGTSELGCLHSSTRANNSKYLRFRRLTIWSPNFSILDNPKTYPMR
jgi:hypothetical protein